MVEANRKLEELKKQTKKLENDIRLVKNLNILKNCIDKGTFNITMSTFLLILSECDTLKKEILESIDEELDFRKKVLKGD